MRKRRQSFITTCGSRIGESHWRYQEIGKRALIMMQEVRKRALIMSQEVGKRALITTQEVGEKGKYAVKYCVGTCRNKLMIIEQTDGMCSGPHDYLY
jgi:hypothetical protein